MNILYSGYIKNLNSATGVVKKMLAMEKAVTRKNIKFKVIFFTSSPIPNHLKSKSIFIPRNKYSLYWHNQFLHSVKNIALKSSCTHLLLRHSGFSPAFPFTFNHKNFKLITEHNTLELPEYIANKNIPFYLSELVSQKFCFKYIDAIFVVTDEIARYEIKRSNLNRKKVLIMTNGIDYHNIPFTPAKPFDGKNIDLLFMGSKNFPWVGLDRFFRGLKEHHCNINLHLVGDSFNNHIPNNYNDKVKIIHHGNLIGPKLDIIFKKCNLAISTLAIIRKNMRSACPLKSREYCARGMPFIYSYDDPDIDGHLGVKKFPLNNNPIDISEIISFLSNINQNNFQKICIDLRSSLQKKIDINLKIIKLLEFFQNINGY